MPFKSEAQRRKFYELQEQGKMSKATVDEWEKATPKDKKLPERIGPKPSGWSGVDEKRRGGRYK
jgi:hypothetical protein